MAQENGWWNAKNYPWFPSGDNNWWDEVYPWWPNGFELAVRDTKTFTLYIDQIKPFSLEL